MAEFRYAQSCPLARATEVVGQRWSLLIVRELLLGPQRFSDLRRRLGGVSASVLAARLADLEGHGVIEQQTLPAPAASQVYVLTEHGLALEPVVVALARWGLRWLLERGEIGDQIEPDWMRFAVTVFGRRTPTPPHRYELIVANALGREASTRFCGGASGPQLITDEADVDLSIRLPYELCIGLLTGMLPVPAVLANPDCQLEGDAELLATLALHFEFDFEGLATSPPPQRPATSSNVA